MTQVKHDFTKEDVVGYEFKHASYAPKDGSYSDDLVVVKEVIHLKDKRQIPNLRFIRNYQRPYFLTLDSQRRHKDKRVWESVDNLRRYECTQAEMVGDIQRKLKMRGGLKTLNRNPYLYGTDITSTVLIKHAYLNKYPDLKSEYRVAHLDIEFDVTYGTDKINMISVSCGSEVYQFVTKHYAGTNPNFIKEVKECYDREVKPILNEIDTRTEGFDFFAKRKIVHDFNIHVEIVDDEFEAVQAIFDVLHNVIKPDMLSIWNLPYDTGKMVQAIKRRGFTPEEIFCDPKVPKDFRYFNLIEGAAKVFDANGVAESKDPCDRWHKVHCPSNFFWVDQMSVRRAVRKHLNKEPSYALGKILEKTFGFGKLKGDGDLRATGLDWHKHMQRHNKIFYCVYNMFDNIGAQLLDEVTLDLRSTFPAQCGYSDLHSYGSQGRKLADDFYFDLLDRGYVLSGVSDKMEKEMDKHLVPLDGWISTLSAHMVHPDMGNKLLEDLPDSITKIIRWVLDIDVKSSYPSTGVWMNLSQETTKWAMCRIRGVSMEEQRRAGLNLVSGKVNSVDIMVNVCKAPTAMQLLQRFKAANGIA
ncbi:DNA-directed DNA polymerase [Serratia phage vB_SmaS-Totoro]|nr:DNA-directed DNA polymerase [Serratia phage vB_SmaS-Totoro]